MTFTLTISTDNVAFDGNRGEEVARILRDIAEKLADHEIQRGKCRDINGNTVGTFGYK